ncbi:MAG: hypothetical protein WAO23_06500, partial [Dethiobacteria bacterium]
ILRSHPLPLNDRKKGRPLPLEQGCHGRQHRHTPGVEPPFWRSGAGQSQKKNTHRVFFLFILW